MREGNKKLERELTDENHRLHNASRENDVFMDAVNELLEIERDDDDTEIWETFKKL